MTIRPSAQGSLAKTPFAHLLLYLQTRQLSGTLAVWSDESDGAAGQDRVLFEGGRLVAMRPLTPAPSLYAALLPLFARENAPYGFYEKQNLLGQRGTLLEEPIDVYTLLARGLRTQARDSAMDAVLERVRGRELRLRPGMPLDRLELTAPELSLVALLQGASATVDTVLGSGVLPPRDAKRTLYLLTLLRGLDVVGHSSIPAAPMESFPPATVAAEPLAPYTLTGVRPPREPQPAVDRASVPVRAAAPLPPTAPAGRASLPRPAESAPSSAPPAPLGLSANDKARWADLAALYDRLDTSTHYELLNVPQAAPPQDVQSAYYGLVKRFHPDKLPLSLAPLARVAHVVFERLTEASTTLSEREARKAYDQAVAEGGGTRAASLALRSVLESALEYQKAEVHVRRREYAQALQLVRSAMSKNADDADSHALHAWLLHLMNPSPPAPFDDMLRSLDRALVVNPRHERAHYYKGIVLKRLKRDREAVRHFRTAAEINPHNVDAAREVRLANMRRESKAPPSGGGGMLSRLFKK